MTSYAQSSTIQAAIAELELRRRTRASETWGDLHEAQREIVSNAARFNVVDCGRRWGKTVMGTKLCRPIIRQNGLIGWFAPSYKMMLEVWNELRELLPDRLKRSNKMEMRMEFFGGGAIDLWSLDNIDAGRGRKYHRVIVDEAAIAKDLMQSWQAAIRPTLTDFKGDAWFLSTPKGRNGFWQLYQLGQDPQQTDWSCWQMPTITNPYMDEGEVESARRELPERIFHQEYLADFIDSGGGVFRNVMECAIAEEEVGNDGQSDYVIGVDWGKMNDFTVVSVLNARKQSLVYIDRFNQIDYHIQTQRLKNICDKFRPVSVVVELNSMGVPLAENLSRMGLPIVGFQTTNATKTAIIDALTIAFEREEISVLNDPVLIGELLAYDMERLPSGMMRYSAPDGQHDDCVMSLAFAWSEIYQPAMDDGYVIHEEDVSISLY